MKYLLALERNHNNYLPIDWNLLPNYNGAPVNELPQIDAYTSLLSENDLKKLLLNANMISDEESTKNTVIIYYNDGYRKLNFGPCFRENKGYLSKEYIYNCLLDNAKNKEFLNRIYNAFSKYHDKSPAFQDLLTAINHLTEDNLYQLNNINYIDYEELRSLGMFISSLMPKIQFKEVNLKNNNGTPSSIYRKELTNKEAA